MAIARLHLISAYLLWCLGTYALWLGEWEDVPPYPILIVLLAILAFALSDHGPRWQLSSLVSNCLGVVILSKMLYDLVDNPQEALTALAHFLCYLQSAKWFRVKIPRDYLLLYLMNILQVAIGAILAKQSSFGLIITIYFFLSIWCGMLFFLGCHLGEIRSAAPPPSRRGDLPTGSYLSLAGRSLRVWAGAMVLSLGIFWLLPRTAREIDLAVGNRSKEQWTGFSSVVSLENDSKVLENGEIAFTIVSATDASGHDVELPPDILWRGNVFSTYRSKEWKRTRVDANLPRGPSRAPSVIGPGQWLIEIEKVANTGNVLLSPAGIVGAEIPRANNSVKFIPSEERLIIDEDVNRSRLRYSVVVDPKAWTDGLVDHDIPPNYLQAVSVAPADLTRVADLAQRLTQDLPADDIKGRIDRVFRQLTESGEYMYSLQSEATSKDLEPIEDFLFERKTGHCEYFASALALLLRHAGVPARLVTGFKGLDQNRAGGYYQVRQLYAHAWVEAFLPSEQRWITLDPTPGEARTIGIERQRTWWSLIDDVRDVFTRIWGYYIVNFSMEDQQRVLLAARANIVRWVGVPMTMAQEILTRSWQQSAWLVISLLGIMAGAGVALVVMGVGFVRRRLARWRRTSRHQESRRPEYQVWLDFLESRQIRFDASHTPHEIAEQARTTLAASPVTARWSDLPPAFADSWCQTRFGHEEVRDEQWNQLDQSRRALQEAWTESAGSAASVGQRE
jgi:transglutaminase-like putative cysteine protease